MFEELKPYIHTINIHEGVYYIQIIFKPNWEYKISNLNVVYEKFDDINTIHGVNESVQMDEILETLKKMVDYNLENEAKMAFFNKKCHELQDIISKTPLDLLLTLKFEFDNIETEKVSAETEKVNKSTSLLEHSEPIVINDTPREPNMDNFLSGEKITVVGEYSAEDIENISLGDLKRRG